MKTPRNLTVGLILIFFGASAHASLVDEPAQGKVSGTGTGAATKSGPSSTQTNSSRPVAQSASDESASGLLVNSLPKMFFCQKNEGASTKDQFGLEHIKFDLTSKKHQCNPPVVSTSGGEQSCTCEKTVKDGQTTKVDCKFSFKADFLDPRPATITDISVTYDPGTKRYSSSLKYPNGAYSFGYCYGGDKSDYNEDYRVSLRSRSFIPKAMTEEEKNKLFGQPSTGEVNDEQYRIHLRSRSFIPEPLPDTQDAAEQELAGKQKSSGN